MVYIKIFDDPELYQGVNPSDNPELYQWVNPSFEHENRIKEISTKLEEAGWKVSYPSLLNYYPDLFAEKDGQTIVVEVGGITSLYKLEQLRKNYGRVLEAQPEGGCKMTLLPHNVKAPKRVPIVHPDNWDNPSWWMTEEDKRKREEWLAYRYSPEYIVELMAVRKL